MPLGNFRLKAGLWQSLQLLFWFHICDSDVWCRGMNASWKLPPEGGTMAVFAAVACGPIFVALTCGVEA